MHRPENLLRSLLTLSVLLLISCAQQNDTPPAAVAIHADDTCAVCGMFLGTSPGPRAQAWKRGAERPLVFDTTRDFFAWLLQPENRTGIAALYVQDTARIDWRHPNDATDSFIDARQAHYVVWHLLPGAMGPTLAPFASESAAHDFIKLYGGALLHFDDITTELTVQLESHCPGQSSPLPGAAHCQQPALDSAPYDEAPHDVAHDRLSPLTEVHTQ